MRDRVISDSQKIPLDVLSDTRFPVDIINRRVEDDIRKLYQKSFYNEFEGAPEVSILYNELRTGRLSCASSNVRSTAIAKLAIMFERNQNPELAFEAVESAFTLAHTHEASLASTLIVADASTTATSLQKLNETATPTARTTALLLIAKLDGSTAALDWYTESGLQTVDLDPEGQLVLCAMLLRQSRWTQALKTASEITSTAIAAMPALNHTIAMAHLVTALPAEYKRNLLDRMPLNVRHYPLLDTPESITCRRTAMRHFFAAAGSAEQFDLPATKANEERYAIWLQLMDPETVKSGKHLLRTRLQPLASALPFMQLGIEFEILDDLSAVQRELNRQRVLNGGETAYTAAASLSILMRMGDPAKLAAYIETRFDELNKHIEPSSLMKARLLALSAAGNVQHASAILAQLPADMLSQTDHEDLARLIPSEGHDSELTVLRLQYESRTSIQHLQTLVHYLESAEQWQELCRYARILFDEAPTATVATSLAYAYYQTNQSQLIIDLVYEEVSFLSMSPPLRLLYCWALHSTGDFREARTQLEHVPITLDDRAYRSLRRNLDISTGYWDNLPMYIQEEIEHIDNRTPTELLETARLASAIKSPSAMSLIRAAARKGTKDAEVLAACNSLATRLGNDADDEVSNWLSSAVDLSTADGPLKTLSSEELVTYRQNWADTRTHIHRLLAAAEIPIFLAAHRLGRGLVDDTLIRAMRNEDTDDIRDRLPVPAYCPKGAEPAYGDVQTLGVDATAVLNLAFLGILEDTIDAFDKIIISSSLLEWLFDEYSRPAIQQPSRLRHASELMKLGSSNKIDFISHHLEVPRGLIGEVGSDVASLLCEAQQNSLEEPVPHLVVHPAPRPLDDIDGSRTKALAEYQSLLTSCSSIVTWLADRGQLTQTELKVARAFLEANEEPWPHPVSVTHRSHLYLSELTIMYLQHLRVLHKLPRSGVTVHALKDSLDEAHWLVSHAELFDQAVNQVEYIRSIIVSGIDSRKIRFARRTMIAESETERLVNHPSIDLVSISAGADAIVCDDRFCNKYAAARQSPKRVPIITTLDLLDVLVRRKRLSCERQDSLRAKLRDAGFIFIPVTEDEILRFLRASRCKDGVVNESAELRAIRDNLHVIRMHGWFQPAFDHWWLDSLFRSVATALPKLWNGQVSRSCAKAYSLWMRAQFNVRHYGHFFHGDDAFAKMRSYEADFFSSILYAAQDLPPSQLANFLAWFDEWMLEPLRWIDEDSHGAVLKGQEAWIDELAGRAMRDHQERSSDEVHLDVAALGCALLDRVPRSVRDVLLVDSDFVAKYQLADHALKLFRGGSITVYSSSLIRSVQRLLSEPGPIEVRNPSGQSCVVQFDNDMPHVPVLSQGDHSMFIREFLMFSPDSSTRVDCFNEAAHQFRMPQVERDQWHQLLLERIPSMHEFDSLISDLHDSPARVELAISESLQKGRLGVELIAPTSPRYYARLIGSLGTSVTIQEFIQEGLGELLEEQMDTGEAAGFSRCLRVAIHPDVAERIPVNEEVGHGLQSMFGHSAHLLDSTSQVAAIELALRMLESIPDVGPSVGSLIEGILNDNVNSPSSGFAAFCNLFIMVDMRLCHARVFADSPPFYRRAAGLAQAALVHSIIARYGVPTDWLFELIQVPQVIFHRVQALVDMRIQPRWHPRYASPAHFKASACARIRRALARAEDRVGEAQLHQLIGSDVIRAVWNHPWSSLKSPPDPVDDRLPNIPDAVVGSLDPVTSNVSTSKSSDSEFTDVIYQSLYSKTDLDISGDVRRVLDCLQHAGSADLDSDNFVSQLHLLATAAGTTRDSEATDQIHSLLLQVLRDQGRHIDFGMACDIGIAACSSSSAHGEWRTRIAKWFESIAHLSMGRDRARVLSMIIETLCSLSPELWSSCGRSYAAALAVRK